MGACLNIVVKCLDSLRFHLHALQALTLELLDCFHHVVDLTLYDGQLGTGANTGVRSHGQEVVREAVDADRHIALRVWSPFLFKRNTGPTVDGDAKLEGVVVT